MFQRRSFSPVPQNSAAKDKQPDKPQQIVEEPDDKRKPSKHKWVPLEIDLSKANKNDRRRSDRQGDVQSTVSEGDRDWRAERDLNGHAYNGKHQRPVSAAPRGRGNRSRGGRRAPFNRPANRMSGDTEYPDYPSEFQVNFNTLLHPKI